MFHEPGTAAHRATEAVIWSFIAGSIGLLAIELTLAELLGSTSGAARLTSIAAETSWRAFLSAIVWVDRAVLALFGVELALRTLSFRPADRDFYARGPRDASLARLRAHLGYLAQPMQIIDLLAILGAHPALRGLRVLRLLRLARAWPLFRHANPVNDVLEAFWVNRLLYRGAFLFLALVTVIGGLSMYLIEQGTNPNVNRVQDGMWWALVTLTTVGFGDITPITPLGRALGSVMMVAGMFTLASFAGIVGSTLLSSILRFRMEQFRMTQTVDHVVVLGFDAGCALLLGTLRDALPKRTAVVLMAQGERPDDLPHDYEWIHGDPTREKQLDKVRLAHAGKVLVVGPRALSPQQADAQTLLTLFTIRSHMASSHVRRRRPLRVVAEILDAENVAHAKTAGADEVIETSQIGFSLLAHAVHVPGAATVVGHVVRAGSHNLYECALPADIPEGTTFGEASNALRRRGCLLIGVHEQGEEFECINPPEDRALVATTRLVYLAEREIGAE
jgi:voltage-gated potassium channel